MNLKDLFGGENKIDDSVPKSNTMLIIIIVCVSLCLISIIGYFIYNATKPKSANGGVLVNSGLYNYHVFTKNDNIIFNDTKQVEYLIIGGGGSGGNNHGGGGGSGRVMSGTIDIIRKSYPIIVGNGGIQPIINSTKDCKGQNSSAFGINAEGGGYGGGDRTGPASSGGSGGGGSGYNMNNENKAIIDAGIANGSLGLGNRGGNGNQDSIAGGGGGGGGSGSPGENGFPNKPRPPYDISASGGKGGSGTNNYSEWLNAIKSIMTKDWISATSKGYIAGGGGGGAWVGSEEALGGEGGGGKGGNEYSGARIRPFPGVPNTGSGGGGGGSNQELGIAGGSGLVIIRYKI